jgi:hypothetical protein
MKTPIPFTNIGTILLLLITGTVFGQNNIDSVAGFRKVYKQQSCPVIPFAKIEVEVSNHEVCYRNVLPPRRNISKEHRQLYD